MEAPPVQYVTTSDGYSIAYAVSGEGRPFVFMPPVMSHIQVYWREDTFVLPWLQGLAARFQLIQYDGRGQGMSGRGLPDTFPFDDVSRDLEALIERLQLQDFILMAAAPFGHVAVRYAIRHPELVRGLVWDTPSIQGVGMPAVFGSLPEEDWEAFLLSIAGLSRATDLHAAVDRLNQATTQEDWLALVRAAGLSSLSVELPRLTTSTLLLQPRDWVVGVSEAQQVAAIIPNARLVTLDGANLGDPAQGLKAIDDFLASLPPRREVSIANPAALPDGLSTREIDVLRLIAAGKSNQQIADELVISLNTVARHVSNIFDKTGARNRVEAASYATRHELA